MALGDLDNKVQQYVSALHRAGTRMNAQILMAATEGIVRATDQTLLRENGVGGGQLTRIHSGSSRGAFPYPLPTTSSQLGELTHRNALVTWN